MPGAIVGLALALSGRASRGRGRVRRRSSRLAVALFAEAGALRVERLAPLPGALPVPLLPLVAPAFGLHVQRAGAAAAARPRRARARSCSSLAHPALRLHRRRREAGLAVPLRGLPARAALGDRERLARASRCVAARARARRGRRSPRPPPRVARARPRGRRRRVARLGRLVLFDRATRTIRASFLPQTLAGSTTRTSASLTISRPRAPPRTAAGAALLEPLVCATSPALGGAAARRLPHGSVPPPRADGTLLRDGAPLRRPFLLDRYARRAAVRGRAPRRPAGEHFELFRAEGTPRRRSPPAATTTAGSPASGRIPRLPGRLEPRARHASPPPDAPTERRRRTDTAPAARRRPAPDRPGPAGPDDLPLAIPLNATGTWDLHFSTKKQGRLSDGRQISVQATEPELRTGPRPGRRASSAAGRSRTCHGAWHRDTALRATAPRSTSPSDEGRTCVTERRRRRWASWS